MSNKREHESMADTHAVVFKESEDLEGKCEKVKGYDFNQGVNYSQLLESFRLTGFQASNLGDAFNLVNQMLDWRLANEEPANDCSEEERDPKFRESTRCKVFLSFTSSLISSGVRDNVRYLVQHHMVDVVITTAGGIEEDLLKCFTPTFERDFPLPADESPDNNCCKLKDWIFPIFDKMLEEQTAEKTLWTLSKLADRLGREINDESSYLYWASKNKIPVFCTDFSDGSLRHMLCLHSVEKPGLIIDVMQDMNAMNGEAVNATPRKTGMICLGGVLPLHLTCNEQNMMKEGADYTVFINTAQASDGSDCGARPDKVVSVDEIRTPPKTVKLHCDATIAFPLLVAKTFAAKREGASFTQNKESENSRGKRRKIEGYDFNQGVNYSELLNSFVSTGFQASSLGDAFNVVNKMLDWRLADEEPVIDCSEEELDPKFRESTKCKVFLGFTSNLISSGVRDIVRYLVQHRMVDVIVTTAGGIEEDLIKCLAPTFKGHFSLPGDYLRAHGWNRIGDLINGNDNYCKFNKWIIPIYNKMLEEQTSGNILWTPSKFIHRLGREINDETSYLYWASKNNIPVFCPGLTDGSMGDILHEHSVHYSSLIVDLVQDVAAINDEAIFATPRKTGMIILGGGTPKHHINNANLMRNGADYAVFINTGQEFDGSDSGASPDEAVSWGKIRPSAESVKVHCDATIAFPLLVAKTFAAKKERR